MQLSLFLWARETPRNFPDRVGATLLGPRRLSPPWAAQSAFTNTENGDLEVDTKSFLWIAGARWHTACGDKDFQVSQFANGNFASSGLEIRRSKVWRFQHAKFQILEFELFIDLWVVTFGRFKLYSIPVYLTQF